MYSYVVLGYILQGGCIGRYVVDLEDGDVLGK